MESPTPETEILNPETEAVNPETEILNPEPEDRVLFARGFLTPTVQTELQAFRAARRVLPMVLVIVGCGMIITSQLMRIGMGIAQILIFDRPIYTAISMWIGAICVLFGVFLLVWTLLAPRRSAHRRMRQLKERYPETPTIVVEFLPDGIALCTDRGETGIRFAYASIKRCIETQDLFVLLTREKQVLSLEKQRLAFADEAGFRRLIRDKCPKAKVNWRAEA